jgi:Uma2 family endonuclease
VRGAGGSGRSLSGVNASVDHSYGGYAGRVHERLWGGPPSGPDIHVAEADATHVKGIRLPGEALSLAAELTSESTRGNDWSDKLKAYGKAGVPVYLLVDMQKETVSVFSAPSSHGYQSSATVEFGQKIRIPEPFDFTLDTSSFS